MKINILELIKIISKVLNKKAIVKKISKKSDNHISEIKLAIKKLYMPKISI